jgi:hypothetical protein
MTYYSKNYPFSTAFRLRFQEIFAKGNRRLLARNADRRLVRNMSSCHKDVIHRSKERIPIPAVDVSINSTGQCQSATAAQTLLGLFTLTF